MTVLILLSAVFVGAVIEGDGIIEGQGRSDIPGRYSPIDPIRIDSDADFATSPGVSSGDGSPGNPWIIEGWEIDGTDQGCCLYVGNTTDHFVIRNCRVHNASGSTSDYYWNIGILLENVENGLVEGNTAENCESTGLYFHRSERSILRDNLLLHNQYNGLVADHSEHVTISGNNASFSTDCGIRVSSSYHCVVYGNAAYGSMMRGGIDVYMGQYNHVENNIIGNELDDGIYLQVTSRNNITHNLVMDNGGNGIASHSSSLNNITGNSITNSTSGIYVSKGSRNNVSENQCIKNRFNGIYLSDTPENRLSNNTLQDNEGNGLYLKESERSDISGNRISGNDDSGIRMENSYDNNTITGNEITLNDFGVLLTDSSNDNILSGNTISSNEHGIRFTDSKRNLACTNRIIDNPDQAYDDGTDNRFFEDYPVGGNFWGDHDGTDQFYGVDQDIPGPDGIGDLPYEGILGSAGSVDRYPLMFQGMNGADVLPPTSSVNDLGDYWFSEEPVQLTMEAEDLSSRVVSVELWYRYWDTVLPWTVWKKHGEDRQESDGWSVDFDFPNGDGYYEFFSIASDLIGHVEAPKSGGDVQCGFDGTLPVMDDMTPSSAGTGEVLNLFAEVTDNIMLEGVTLSYRFGSGSLTNVSMTNTTGGFEVDVEVPLNSTEDLNYSIKAADAAGNINSTPFRLIDVIDIVAPDADAGADITVDEGEEAAFNATLSSDNIGIANITWSFFDGVGEVTLYGWTAEHTFIVPGQYAVTLTVSDEAGNNGTDGLTVTVLDVTDPVADAGPDLNVTLGSPVILDGSGSFDNVGIVEYQWSFSDGDENVTLDGESVNYTFNTVGNHTVTLTVWDTSGRRGNDTMIVWIKEPLPGDDDDDTPVDDDDDDTPVDDDDDDTPVDDDDDDKDAGSDNDNMWLVFVLGALVLILLVVLVLVLAFGRSRGGLSEE